MAGQPGLGGQGHPVLQDMTMSVLAIEKMSMVCKHKNQTKIIYFEFNVNILSQLPKDIVIEIYDVHVFMNFYKHAYANI